MLEPRWGSTANEMARCRRVSTPWRRSWLQALRKKAGGSHLDLGRAPYVLYGVKYIDPVPLAPFSGTAGTAGTGETAADMAILQDDTASDLLEAELAALNENINTLELEGRKAEIDLESFDRGNQSTFQESLRLSSGSGSAQALDDSDVPNRLDSMDSSRSTESLQVYDLGVHGACLCAVWVKYIDPVSLVYPRRRLPN